MSKTRTFFTLPILILALIAITMLTGCGKDDPVTLPYSTGEDEEQGLEISALYTFSGPNPDCNNEEGEDIAALTVTNNSGNFYDKVKITVVMADESEYNFKIDAFPDGKTAELFDIDNKSYVEKDDDGNKIEIAAINHEEGIDDDAGLMEDQLTVKVKDNETVVKIKNQSDKDMDKLVMYCHTVFDDSYFGGVAYKYSVGDIKAGKKAKVDAEDCMFGTAEVVKIEQESN